MHHQSDLETDGGVFDVSSIADPQGKHVELSRAVMGCTEGSAETPASKADMAAKESIFA